MCNKCVTKFFSIDIKYSQFSMSLQHKKIVTLIKYKQTSARFDTLEQRFKSIITSWCTDNTYRKTVFEKSICTSCIIYFFMNLMSIVITTSIQSIDQILTISIKLLLRTEMFWYDVEFGHWETCEYIFWLIWRYYQALSIVVTKIHSKSTHSIPQTIGAFTCLSRT